MKKTILGVLIISSVVQASNWIHANYKNSFNNKITKRIYTKATNNKNIHLAIRCKEKNLEIIINWNEEIRERPSVQLSIDNKIQKKERWNNSTNKKATFSRNSKQLIKKLIHRTKLSARTIPKSGNPIVANFNIDKIGIEVQEVRRTCR